MSVAAVPSGPGTGATVHSRSPRANGPRIRADVDAGHEAEPLAVRRLGLGRSNSLERDAEIEVDRGQPGWRQSTRSVR